MASPRATGGRYRRLSSSEPASSRGTVPSLFTAGISEEAAQTRATSSMTIAVARASAPAPPYSTGMCGACRSAARSASYDARGNSPVSSAAAAFGATLSSQTSRAAARMAACSSVRSNKGKSLTNVSRSPINPTIVPGGNVRQASPMAPYRLSSGPAQPPRVPRYERRTGVTIAYPNNQALQTPLPVSPPSGAQRPRLTFLGTGYLGATYAVCFAEMGYEVLGLDPDEPKIAKLASGQVPFD